MSNKSEVVRTPRFRWEQEVLRIRTPTPTVKLIGLVLASHSNARTGGQIWPGSKLLAEECGVSMSTVQRGLAELERLGLIVQTRKGRSFGRGSSAGLASEYQLCLPRPADNPTAIHGAPVTDEYGKHGAPVTDEYAEKHRSTVPIHDALTTIHKSCGPYSQRMGDHPPDQLTPDHEAPDHHQFGSPTMSPRTAGGSCDQNDEDLREFILSWPDELRSAWLQNAAQKLGVDATDMDLIRHAVDGYLERTATKGFDA